MSSKRLFAGALLSIFSLSASASLGTTPDENPIKLINPEIGINGRSVPFDPTSSIQQYATYWKDVVITLGSLPSVVAHRTETRMIDEFGAAHSDSVGILTYQVAVTSSKTDPIPVSVSPKKSTSVSTTIWPDKGSAQGTASVFFMMKDSFGRAISYGLECVMLYSTYYFSNSEDCANPDFWPDIEAFNFMMLPNTPYSIILEASVVAEAAPGNEITSYAYIDPIFSFAGDAPSDAKFIYSPGVSQYVAPSNEVSEPTSVALVAVTAAMTLLSRRRSRDR